MTVASPDRTPTDEVMDFLLSAPTPEEVITLRPSQAAQERLRYLLATERNGRLNDKEHAELESIMQLEHFVRLLKLHARKKIAENSDG